MGKRYKRKIPIGVEVPQLSRTARIPGIFGLVDSSIAFRRAGTHQELREQLQPLPRIGTLQLLSIIGAMLHNNRNTTNKATQLNFLKEFSSYLPYHRRIVTELERAPDSVLIHEELLAVMHKFVALYSTGGSWPRQYQANIVQAMLACNYLLGHENTPDKVTESDDFVRLELRALFHQNEGVLSLVHRYSEFVEWTGSDEAKRLADIYLPVKDDFENLIGMTYESYVTCAFAVLAHFMRIKSIADASIALLNIDSFLSTLQSPETLRRWILENSRSFDDFRAAVSGAEEHKYAGVHLLPLLKRPLILIGDKLICCPYIGFLENMMGAGLYFKLDHAYKDRGKGQQFPDLFARFFEKYVVGIVERISQASGLRFEAERKWAISGGPKSNKSTDVVLVEPSSMVWMEVVATRINYAKTLSEFNQDSVNRDFKNIIFKKARQLHDNIEAFRRKDLKFDGLDPADYPRIYPVIVTVHPIPHFIGVTGVIEAHLKSEKHLQDTKQLQIIDIESIEKLEVPLSEGLHLSDLLEEKLKQPGTAAQTMRNYKHYVNKSWQRNYSKYMLDRWSETAEKFESNLRAWGLPTEPGLFDGTS
jgi:hypothetical protein